MAKQSINVGASANDKKGDSLRAAFQKVNANFTELYEAVGLSDTGQDTALTFLGSTISTDDSSSITVDRATTVTSNLTVGGDILPQTANGGDLGSSAKPWRSLYVSNSTIYLGGNSLKVDANGEILINNNRLVQDNGNYISLNLNVNDVIVSDPQVGDTLQWAGGFWVNGTPSGGGGSTAWTDITGKPTFSTVATSGSYNDLSDKPNLAGTYQFSVAADDSTQRLISSDEVIKFIGSGTVTTASDAEGNITITGSGITASSSDTFTNKTINIQTGQNNTFQIQGNSISSYSGSGAVVLLQSFPTLNAFNIGNGSNLTVDGGSGSYYWSGPTGVAQAGIDKAGVYRSSSSATNSLFTFAANGSGTMSAAVEGSLFIGTGMPSNNGGLNTDYPGWLVVQSGGKFGGDVNTLGKFILDSAANGAIIFGDGTTQTTAYTGPQTSLDGDVTGSVFADDSTLLVDGVSGVVPNSELAKSITQVIDSDATVNTSATVTTNNSYTNTVDFSTDVDPGVGYAIAGWYQRNSEQIEFALFGPSAFQTYLTGLALGRTVIVTYSTGSGNQTLTRTLTQRFSATGQSDPANPTWGRVSGRIDATLPADQTGIVSINFPVYSTSNNTWTFGANGDLTLPRGYFKNNTTDGFLKIEGPLFADMVSLGGGGYATISNGVEIVTHSVGTDTERKFRFSWDGSLYMPVDSGNSQVGTIEWRNVGTATAQIQTIQGSGTSPDGLYLQTYGTNTGTTIAAGFNKKWIYRDDGTLTIPGDIKSEGNINIDINLADSTLRRWQFGEDGKLTFPDGANYAGQTVTMPTTTTGTTNSFVWEFSDNVIGSDTITLNWNLLASDTGSFYIGTTHSTNGKYLILDGNDQSLSYIAGGVPTNGKLIFGSTAGNNAGDVNAIELKAADGDVYLTSTESVKITVDAADSSARIWTFDPTGKLTFPDSTVQSTAWTGGVAWDNVTNKPSFFSGSYNDLTDKPNLGGTYQFYVAADDSTQQLVSSDNVIKFIGAGGITTASDADGNITITGSGGGGGAALEEPFESKTSATGVVEHNANTNRLFYHSSISASFTANFTNLGLSAGEATSVTLVLVQGVTARMCTAVQIAGAAQTILWQGASSAPSGNASRTDVVTFSILCTATDTYTVLGMLTSFGGA